MKCAFPGADSYALLFLWLLEVGIVSMGLGLGLEMLVVFTQRKELDGNRSAS